MNENGVESGMENKPTAHKLLSDKQARPCTANDLILVAEGLQCWNCMAITRDHGKTWISVIEKQ